MIIFQYIQSLKPSFTTCFLNHPLNKFGVLCILVRLYWLNINSYGLCKNRSSSYLSIAQSYGTVFSPNIVKCSKASNSIIDKQHLCNSPPRLVSQCQSLLTHQTLTRYLTCAKHSVRGPNKNKREAPGPPELKLHQVIFSLHG